MLFPAMCKQPHVHVQVERTRQMIFYSTLNLNSSMSFKSSGESLIKIYQEILTVNICI